MITALSPIETFSRKKHPGSIRALIFLISNIGEGSMIDMGAVLGGRAEVGKHCHVGAGAVLAGVIEPPSASPVILEDDVLIGANAVVIEGVHIGKGAVVGAGSIVTQEAQLLLFLYNNHSNNLHT